jgi:hypothetical protein
MDGLSSEEISIITNGTSMISSQAPHFFLLPGCPSVFGELLRGRRPSRSFARTRRRIWTMLIDRPEDGSPGSTPHARRPDACSRHPRGPYGRHRESTPLEGGRRSRVMAKPKPEKKPAAAAPSTTRVLPMKRQIGDILSDELSEWRVIGRRAQEGGDKLPMPFCGRSNSHAALSKAPSREGSLHERVLERSIHSACKGYLVACSRPSQMPQGPTPAHVNSGTRWKALKVYRGPEFGATRGPSPD